MSQPEHEPGERLLHGRVLDPDVSVSVARRDLPRDSSIPRLPLPERSYSPTLLGIPQELRIKILKHLLVFDKDRSVEIPSEFINIMLLTEDVRRRNLEITHSWTQAGFLEAEAQLWSWESPGISIPDFSPKRIECKPSFHPNILRVCHQLYHEGKTVFHQQNKFITASGPLEKMRMFEENLTQLGNLKWWNARVCGKTEELKNSQDLYDLQEWDVGSGWAVGSEDRRPWVRLAAEPSENEQPPK